MLTEVELYKLMAFFLKKKNEQFIFVLQQIEDPQITSVSLFCHSVDIPVSFSSLGMILPLLPMEIPPLVGPG